MLHFSFYIYKNYNSKLNKTTPISHINETDERHISGIVTLIQDVSFPVCQANTDNGRESNFE